MLGYRSLLWLLGLLQLFLRPVRKPLFPLPESVQIEINLRQLRCSIPTMTLLSKLCLTYALTYVIGLFLGSGYFLSSELFALEMTNRSGTAIFTYLAVFVISCGLGEILACSRPASFEEPKDLLWIILLFKISFAFSIVLRNAVVLLEDDLLIRNDCDKIKPNPDIVGSGVRCSMYILLLFVFVSLLMASFHTQQSGTKELGCSVLISRYLLVSECMISELILYRSLRYELELSYG